MSFFNALDTVVFLFLNRGFANPVFDTVMPFVTNVHHWKIPIVIIWLALMVFGRKKGRVTAILVVVILVLSDQLSSSVIKPWINRTRPCFVLSGVRLLIDQSGSPSFPSSHAANMAAMAVLFSVKYRRFAALFIAIALVVSYSRIYVGVHYPSDLIGGWVVGIACAATILMAEKQIRIIIKRNRLEKNNTPE
jgi:undecaprenyl-diphosphatase